jgi:nitrite reductase (NADH) small subunit
MVEYVVGKVDEFRNGVGIAVKAGARTIAIFRLGERFFAINNACPHKGASLCEGEVLIDRGIVRCPWHHWNWQLADGQLEADTRQRLRSYEITVDDGQVVVRT